MESTFRVRENIFILGDQESLERTENNLRLITVKTLKILLSSMPLRPLALFPVSMHVYSFRTNVSGLILFEHGEDLFHFSRILVDTAAHSHLFF